MNQGRNLSGCGLKGTAELIRQSRKKTMTDILQLEEHIQNYNETQLLGRISILKDLIGLI